MKNLFYLILFVMFCSKVHAQKPADYIAAIPGYNHSGAFSDYQYAGLTWQEFYKIFAANQILHPENVDIKLFNAALFFATNKIRQQYGKSVLKFSDQLANAAMTHSYNMVKQNFFNHVNPKPGPLVDMKSRIQAFGYDGQAMGENIAKGYVDLKKTNTYIQVAETVIKQFYNSPPHRANMLKSSFQYTGQAGFFYSKPQYAQYWYFCVTQDYGSPWK